MNVQEPLPQIRAAIAELISRAEQKPQSFLKKLKELKEKHKIQVFSNVILVLTHLDLSESEAEKHLMKILLHREEMEKKLRRDLGLRVAALDYFLNIEKRLDNPKVVELAIFEQTEKSALTDWLTGLHNLRFFRICLQKEFHRARRYKSSLSLLFMDIDNFKDVNDAYGHLFGDMVLKEVSRIIKKTVRDSDLPFRYGGEEFAVVLPETTRLGSYIVAERVRKGIEVHFRKKEVAGQKVCVTASGGISVFPEDALTDIEMIKKADQALYNAKAGGKNKISIFYMERRSFIRFDIAGGDALVRIIRAKDRSLGEVLCAKNISKGGILFETSEMLEVGEEIKIIVKSLRDKKKIEIRGRVMRLEEVINSDGRKGYDVGVAFVSDSAQDQREFISFFASYKRGIDLSTRK